MGCYSLDPNLTLQPQALDPLRPPSNRGVDLFRKVTNK
jgi:hypothetical protein